MKYVAIFLLFYMHVIANENLINVNFKDLSIMQLISITSEKINKSILVTNKIEGKVDFISNKPINKQKLLEILKYSLDDYGYTIIEKNDILRVVKKSSIPKKYRVKNNKKTSNLNKKFTQFSTKIIPLVNVEVKNIEPIVKKIIEKRNYGKNIPSISIDESTNSIIVDGKKSIVDDIFLLINNLDEVKAQVYVKAKIIEVDDNLIEDIGFKFGILGGEIHTGSILTFSSNLNGGNAIAIDTSSVGLQIPNVSSTLALGATLSLLNKTYALDIISEPSILCLNNKESSIYVGETISIQTGSTITDVGTTTNTFQREDIGLKLKVKPRVFENKVLLNINTILEGVKNAAQTNSNPDTSKKELITSAIVNNGESVILGGLLESKSEKTIQKVAFVGDIPLIGELFKNRLNDNRRKNLVVIITPYIIPKEKDLTYIRDELAKLKTLEDSFLEKVLLSLRKKKQSKEDKKENLKEPSSEQLHKERLKEYLNL